MNSTKFFATKDQYMAFRKAFADASVSPEVRKGKPGPTGEKTFGWLRPEHYMLLNIVRGIPWYRGFSPKTSKNFMEAGGQPNLATQYARYNLFNAIDSARTLLEPKAIVVPTYLKTEKEKERHIAYRISSAQEIVNKFLKPFGGAFTLLDLSIVNLPGEPDLAKLDYDKVAGTQTTYVAMLAELPS